jgi:hypothetical protein
LDEGGAGGVKFDTSSGDGTMLRVVDDAVDLAEDVRTGCGHGKNKRYAE